MNYYRFDSTKSGMFWIVLAETQEEARKALIERCLDQSFELNPDHFKFTYGSPIRPGTVCLGVNPIDRDHKQEQKALDNLTGPALDSYNELRAEYHIRPYSPQGQGSLL